jgi:hypothetical protein
MERIASMDIAEYSRWAIGSQHAMFRAAAARLSGGRSDLPQAVELAHAVARVAEPPRPYSIRIAKLRAAGAQPAVVARVVDGDGVVKSWSTALARCAEAER